MRHTVPVDRCDVLEIVKYRESRDVGRKFYESTSLVAEGSGDGN